MVKQGVELSLSKAFILPVLPPFPTVSHTALDWRVIPSCRKVWGQCNIPLIRQTQCHWFTLPIMALCHVIPLILLLLHLLLFLMVFWSNWKVINLTLATLSTIKILLTPIIRRYYKMFYSMCFLMALLKHPISF